MDAEPVGGVLEGMAAGGHELVVHGHDPVSGLRAIIAIHSTRLGPALGGTRFRRYPTEAAALTDALRLAEGMTLKAAAAGLDLGGGKAVLVGDPLLAGPDLWAAYGRLVDRLGGAYITAEDVGTTVADMVLVAGETRWVMGLPLEQGGSGDPSPMTARGVRAAMTAAAEHLWGGADLTGRRIAIQGVGKVGSGLARLLAADGADLVVADARPEVARSVAAETGAAVADPEDVLFTEADIVAPCALGAVLSPTTIPGLRCAAVVGSANNQLAHEGDAKLLADAGILYAPDFVVNAGGIINIATEVAGAYDAAEAGRQVDGIHDTMVAIFRRADRDGTTPHEAAVAAARDRLEP
jgi:glutamate dehydrogenase/leucine dehydrogenase